MLLGAFIAILIFNPSMLLLKSDMIDRKVEIARICLQVLQSKQTLGLKYSINSETGKIDFDLGGLRESSGSESIEIIDRVLGCVEKAYSKEGLKNTLVVKRPLPLGLISQQWTKSLPSIYLERPSNEEDEIILNNIRVGPINGDKRDILSNWCKNLSSCITCDPNPNGNEFNNVLSVSFSLNQDAPLVKEKMWGNWLNPQDPWELVDNTGTRYLYRCVRGK